MTVGLLQLELRLPEAQSLKEKRWLLKSLITRMRNRFNVSVSEVEERDLWQRATLAVVSVGETRIQANRLLDQVLDFTEANRQVEIIDSQLEFF